MAATTTPHTNELLRRLQEEFPNFSFARGDIFYWSSTKQIIYYSDINSDDDIYDLLHELSHALLKHKNYTLDIELVRLEVEAWEYTSDVLGPKHGLDVPVAYVQDALDSYRHWLFKRSLCPLCFQTGMQATKNTYKCLNCRCSWRVNDAKLCALRRSILTD